jgi:hypothetical protein
MTKHAKLTEEGRNRSDTLNMRLDPKLKYLATIAAKYQDRSLSNFIEEAIRRALMPDGVDAYDDQPPALPLWGEGLWDENESVRLFFLATNYPNLLGPSDSKLWTLLSGELMRDHGKITLKRFVESYNAISKGDK